MFATINQLDMMRFAFIKKIANISIEHILSWVML